MKLLQFFSFVAFREGHSDGILWYIYVLHVLTVKFVQQHATANYDSHGDLVKDLIFSFTRTV